jgi:hypothetical protein
MICSAVILFLLIWAFTIPVFWPMNRELFRAASGSIVRSDAELMRADATVGHLRLVASGDDSDGIRFSCSAISIPFPRGDG